MNMFEVLIGQEMTTLERMEDYVHLRMGAYGLNVYTPFVFHEGNRDSAKERIVQSVRFDEMRTFELRFEDGSVLVANLEGKWSGPEALELFGPDNFMVVVN